jgi:hypothetical protein
MNASWPNESTPEIREYTEEEDAQMLREADELQRSRLGSNKAVKRIVKDAITETLATAPKGAWKSWTQLWKEAGKP